MKRVPEGVIERLSIYLKCLLQLEAEGLRTASSGGIGRLTGINPAEIRRDLVLFGTFGTKGVGYEIKYLIRKIHDILGSDAAQQIAIVGAGNLGNAIAKHFGLRLNGFKVSAIFDTDPAKIGVAIGGVKISHTRDLAKTVSEKRIKIGILAVPPENAQAIADLLVKAGVGIILNYTPIMIKVPAAVQLHNSDPVNELLYTLTYLSKQIEKGPGEQTV